LTRRGVHVKISSRRWSLGVWTLGGKESLFRDWFAQRVFFIVRDGCFLGGQNEKSGCAWRSDVGNQRLRGSSNTNSRAADGNLCAADGNLCATHRHTGAADCDAGAKGDAHARANAEWRWRWEDYLYI